jgi:hypothetical protein
VYAFVYFLNILNCTVEVHYKNSSAVEVCVLHFTPQNSFQECPSTIPWYPQKLLYGTNTDYRFHHVFVSFVSSVTNVGMPLNIHESRKYVIRE